jgi:hypothetical protein
MTQTYLNGKYTVRLSEDPLDQTANHFHRPSYTVLIKNNHTKTHCAITNYQPSPMHTTDTQKCNDALSFILNVATEWRDDQRNDDDDNFFQTIYDQIHPVIPDNDIDDLSLYFYNKECEETP